MRRLPKLAAAAALAMAPALAWAAAPDQAAPPKPGQPALSIPDSTIGKAGAALHDVADLQRKYQPRIEAASPQQKQSLSEQANAEAVQAIQSHGLSIQEYSQVVRTAQNNPEVKQRLLDAANKAQ
jgi:hypothetical protein